MVKANKINISYETYGESKDPTFLLINGSIGQGVLWPEIFCKKLANKGYYVIRYDHRDAGRSSFVDDDQEPYDLMDLADDAVGLLTSLHIEKANFFGLSMGAPIAELIAANYSNKVISIGLSGGYYDYRPLALKGAGLPLQANLLSAPTDHYYQGLAEIAKMPINTSQEMIDQKMATWNLFNGSIYPLDKAECEEMFRECIHRTSKPLNIANYRRAMRQSEQMVLAVHSQVHVPTVIFHGTVDPLIGIDHAVELAKKINNSIFYPLDGMGHLLNPHFYDFIADKLDENAKR